nr:MAG TPA: hypothetical protein [Caudoviricetes sp.]
MPGQATAGRFRRRRHRQIWCPDHCRRAPAHRDRTGPGAGFCIPASPAELSGQKSI